MLKSADNRLKVLIFFLSFLIYGNTIGNDYAWDDSIVITENARVQRGVAGIPDLFVKYNSDYKADKYGYRPITLTSFAVDQTLCPANPVFGHFMNVLYFALLCCVVFTVLRKLFSGYTNLAPFLITLLFVAHPIHVEVVANIKSRDELLALLFSMLSLGQLINYYNNKRYQSILFFVLLFLLSFLSKESAVSFLFVMGLSLIYPDNGLNKKKLLLPAGCFVLLLTVCAAVIKAATASKIGAASSAGAGIFYESKILGNSFFFTDRIGDRLANASILLLLYLKNFFFPARLLYFYGYNQIPVANWGQPLVILSCIVHITIAVLSVVWWKKHRALSWGILFYLSSIAVYLHVVTALPDTMADRFLFTPSLGLIAAVVFGTGILLKIDYKTLSVQSLFGGGLKNGVFRIPKYAFALIFLLLGCRAYSRNMDWKNNATLVAHDMPYLDNCARAHNYLADILKNRLHEGYDAETEAEMIYHYRRSIDISHDSYYSYLGLGTYYSEAKKYAEGIAVLDTMATLFPNQADPHLYLGQALYNTGAYDKAIPHLRRAVLIAPKIQENYTSLALAYSADKKFDSAFTVVNEAQKLFSDSAGLYDILATIYFDKGDIEQSTRTSIKMLQFGADPKLVYRRIIGRYQLLHMDTEMRFYLGQARAAGISL